MASISSISGAQSALPSLVSQLRLQQARRNADEAEATARALQAQASDARQRADAAQEDARSIGAQADRARTNVAQARLNLALTRTVDQTVAQLSAVVTRVAEIAGNPKTAGPNQAVAPPVTNTEGQVTGTVINTAA